MTTQYTPILKLALPVTGELTGTWGTVVNDNITSMVEQAVAGLATINVWTANSHTLTTANGTTSESRCAMLVAATGGSGTALTAAGEIICPAFSKLYILKNESAYAVTLKTAAGSGVSVPAGNASFLFCDGVNVNACVTDIAGYAKLASPTFTGVPAAPTAAADTNTTQVATTAYVVGQGYLKSATASSTYAPLASPTFTGVPAAPTAAADTNTTQVATTAYVVGQGYLKSATAASTYLALAGGAMTGGFKEKYVAVAASDIDLSLGNFFSKTISGSTTFTVSNVPTSGSAVSLILDLTNGGSATITWWSGVKWPSGLAPYLTASGRDVLGFFTYDGGTTWTGLVLGKDVK